MNHIKEKVMEGVFLFTAVISIIAVALICVFLFANGFPAMQKIGVWQFLSEKYGNRPIIYSESFR